MEKNFSKRGFFFFFFLGGGGSINYWNEFDAHFCSYLFVVFLDNSFGGGPLKLIFLGLNLGSDGLICSLKSIIVC